MTPMERLVITGYTNEGDKKHKSLNPAHKVLKPYPVPNFKLHSLTNTQITNKEMPPIRLIASSRNGPTYKLGKWLSGILTPLSIEYCGEEYIRDSAHFLTKLNTQSYPPDKDGLCFTVDVNKLYPSITETLVMESLDHALSQSKISVPRRLTINTPSRGTAWFWHRLVLKFCRFQFLDFPGPFTAKQRLFDDCRPANHVRHGIRHLQVPGQPSYSKE